MKFRRLACDCCKTTAGIGRCKSPTYVLSEVIDQSNVIFLLISKAGRPACDSPVAAGVDPSGDEPRTIPLMQGLADAQGFAPDGRAGAIIASLSHPDYRPALDGGFDRTARESPRRRNQRMIEEASGFWPKRTANCNAEVGVREWE